MLYLSAFLVVSNLYLCGYITLSTLIMVVRIVGINQESVNTGLDKRCKCVLCLLIMFAALSIAAILCFSGTFKFNRSCPLILRH